MLQGCLGRNLYITTSFFFAYCGGDVAKLGYSVTSTNLWIVEDEAHIVER